MLNVYDVILSPIYAVVILLLSMIAWRLWLFKYISIPWMISIVCIKMLCAAAYGMVYEYYYTYGDTMGYFFSAKLAGELLLYESPKDIFHFFTSASLKNDFLLAEHLLEGRAYWFKEVTFFMIKITAIFNTIALNTYTPSAMLMGFVCLTGMFALYADFCERLQIKSKLVLLCFFFVPSVVFWSAGIMKDTVTLGALCWATVAFLKITDRKLQYGLWPLIFVICFFVINNLKAYIVYALFPAIGLYLLTKIWNSLISPKARSIFTFSLCTALGLFAAAFVYFEWYNLADDFVYRLIRTAQGFQDWHEYLADSLGGSGYTLGEIEFTLTGILLKVPAGINVALFRPYIFEVNSIVMLISSVESTLILLFTVYTILKVGIRNIIRFTFRYPVLLFLFVYAMVFLFAVGFTSFNFGALVRYKIPGFMFYAVYLAALISLKQKDSKLSIA